MQTEGRASLNDANDGPPEGADNQGRRRQIILFAAVALTVLTLDVTSKIAAVAFLSDREPIPLLGGLLTLRLIRNPGAAFGLAEGYTVILSLIALTVIVVVIRLSRKLASTPWAVAFGLLLGGVLGNFSDRVFRDPGVFRGHVVDFLQLPHWPVFNVADSAIDVAAVTIVVLALLGRRWDGTVDRPRRTTEQAATDTGQAETTQPPATQSPATQSPATRPADGKPIGTTE
jgi:signal peptidase II